MTNQLVFIDTEFTDFFDPQLISIGLAASTGEEFYAEVPYQYEKCSAFVREVVVPLLSHNDLCPYDELHLRLREWLKIIKGEENILVCYDSDYDRALFVKAFGNILPAFVEFRHIGDRNINELLRYEFHVKNKLPEHHALNDALANRYAFREWPLPIQKP